LTGTVKIYEDPHVYVYDTPGVMVPYLGKGKEGAERGMKLALTGEWVLWRREDISLTVQRESKKGSLMPMLWPNTCFGH